MNTKFCTCAYYKCVDRGLKPANHALTCPLFKKEDSPFKEVWLRKNDVERYNKMNEKRTNGIKEARANGRLSAQVRYKEKNPFCLVCGAETSNMHHVIFKSQSNYLRYSENNLVPLCMRCHFKLHNIGDSEILGTIIKKKGMKWFDKLQQDRHIICKMKKEYLEGIIESLSSSTPF